MWNKITLGQYQSILPILEEDGNELDKLVRMISKITCKDESEIDGWELQKLHDYKFLFELDFPKVCPKMFKANGKWYKFVHEIQRMPAARYIESKTFMQDGLMNNLHNIMASCVVPCEKTLWGFNVLKYNAEDHSKYAEDMKEAPFTLVYNACLFFCLVFVNWMKGSQTYLMEVMMEVMTEEQAKEFTQHLINTSDGLIQVV